MKIKGFIIFGILMIIIGCGVCVGGFAMADFDHNNLYEDVDAKKEIKSVSSKDTLKLEGTVCDFVIKKSDDEFINFSYTTTKYDSVEITEESNQVTFIQKHDHRRWYVLLYPFWRDNIVTVYVPSSVSRIEIKNTTGDVEIYDCDFVDAKVKVTTGEVEIKDCSIIDLSIKVTTGDIDMYNNAGSSLIINDTTGDIKMKSSDYESTNIISTTGDVKVYVVGVKADYEISLSTTTGDANIDDTTSGDRSLNITTTTGEINVYFG